MSVHDIKDKYEEKLLVDPNILNHTSSAKILELSSKLQHLKFNLCERFTSLSIQESISQDGVPFLHIWKPIHKSSGVQGMPFLPCFHIIVTLTCGSRIDGIDSSTYEKALFQLHSYHGKVLADESISLNSCDKNADYNLISRMAEDRLRMCRGIEDISGVKFAQFVKSCDLQMLSKIRSVLLIEQFMGEVVLRSRLCEFALYNTADFQTNCNEIVRCEECNAIVNDDAIQDDYADFSDGLNVFQRVYNETSVSDLESMAIFQQMYEQSNRPLKLKRKKKKIKQSSINVKTEPKVDINIKTEPEDSYGIIAGDGVHVQPQFGEHFMAHDSNLGDANKMVKAEIKDGVFEGSSQNALGENGNSWLNQQSCSDDDDLDPNGMDSKQAKMVDYSDLDDASLSKRERKEAEQDRKKIIRNQRNEEKEKRRNERKEKRKDEKTKREQKKKMEPPFNETCVICLYNYRSFQNFNRDKIRHEQVLSNLMDPVTCPLCNSTIPTKYSVTPHFEEFHSENNVTCCCECLELIPKGSDRLRRHILQVHHSATEKRVCQDCGRECSTKQALEVHIAETHTNEKVALCVHCGKEFGHIKRLEVHLRRHHQPRDLQCPHCDKKFETRHQASKHLLVHTGIKPYKCNLCQYASYRQDNVLSVHFAKSHGRKGTSADILVDINERDMMVEIAGIEVEEMLKSRKLNMKLKKENKVMDI